MHPVRRRTSRPEQSTHRRHIPAVARTVQRKIALTVERRRTRTGLEQQNHNIGLASHRRMMQRRRSLGILGMHIGLAVQQRLHHRRIAALRCKHQRRQTTAALLGVHIRPSRNRRLDPSRVPGADQGRKIRSRLGSSRLARRRRIGRGCRRNRNHCRGPHGSRTRGAVPSCLAGLGDLRKLLPRDLGVLVGIVVRGVAHHICAAKRCAGICKHGRNLKVARLACMMHRIPPHVVRLLKLRRRRLGRKHLRDIMHVVRRRKHDRGLVVLRRHIPVHLARRIKKLKDVNIALQRTLVHGRPAVLASLRRINPAGQQGLHLVNVSVADRLHKLSVLKIQHLRNTLMAAHQRKHIRRQTIVAADAPVALVLEHCRNHALAPLERRMMQRRVAVDVLQIRVRTVLQQHAPALHIAFVGRILQRRLALKIHRINGRAARNQQLADRIRVRERCLVQRRRPELVHRLDVHFLVDEKLNTVDLARVGREMHRGVLIHIARHGIGLEPHERLADLAGAEARRKMNRKRTVLVVCVNVRIHLGHKKLSHIDLAAHRRKMQRLIALNRARIHIRTML
eukprot:comp22370_c0_seq1/m.54166 comp22370_c0_seq1/g.54166  ORF comp22370_c0_seq1/g.54166 comp22370_c0_seq1/m.54166 type:complete len:566 (-) comp22370_c0_seq1:1007-2704(-)